MRELILLRSAYLVGQKSLLEWIYALRHLASSGHQFLLLRFGFISLKIRWDRDERDQ